MIKIAHRGNYAGRNGEKENTPSYIEQAIAAGYDVEVDVWLIERQWYLGHDFPRDKIDRSFLERPQIWTHAKNLVGHVSLWNNIKVHVFWHDRDEFVFTSKGIKWAAAGVVTNDGIMVMPTPDLIEEINLGIIEPLGVCADNFSLFTV